MSRNFNITVGKFKFQKDNWNSNPVSLDSFIKSLSTHRETEKKDGLCFVPGAIVGDKRTKVAISQIDFLVFDIDGGQSFAEVDAILKNSGYVAVLYTTYSHLVSKTDIRTDAYKKWAEKHHGHEVPTLKDMKAYLADNGKVVTNVVFDLENNSKEHLVHTPEGLCFIVKHDPVEKYRVVFPLAEPIIIRELSSSTNEAIEIYKSIYNGVGQTLGLVYDKSCATLERLHYLPSHPASGKESFKTILYNKINDQPYTLMDINNFSRLEMEREEEVYRAVNIDDFAVVDRNSVRINVFEWAKENPDFDLEGMLKECLPQTMIRDDRGGGGFHIECPFESRHSTIGGNGTYAVNGNENFPWTIFCSHNSCQSDNRKRAHFLAQYIKDGHISAEDLGIKKKVDSAAESLGIDPKTLPKFSEDEELGEGYGAEEAEATASDTSLGKDEVYTRALEQLRGASTYKPALIAVKRMIKMECEVDEHEIGQAIGESKVKTKVLTLLGNQIEKHSSWNWDTIKTEARTKRCESNVLATAIDEVYNSRVIGYDLDTKLKEVAENYLQLEKDVRKIYVGYAENGYHKELSETAKEAFRKLEEQWAQLQIGSKLVWLDKKASPRIGKPSYINTDGFANIYKAYNLRIFTATKTGQAKMQEVNLVEEWRKRSTTISKYDGVVYIPNGPERDEYNRFNYWTKEYMFRIKPKPGDCSRILNHIREVWCNGDEKIFNWVILWLAAIMQRPEHKQTTALVLTGDEGTGKSIIVESCLSLILGPACGSSANKEDIIEKFNTVLEGKLLFLGEEITFSGDKAGMQKIKNLITESNINLQNKGFEIRESPSFTRFIFTSNLQHSVHLGATDRRLFISKCSSKFVGDLDYFDSLKSWMKAEGAAYFLDYLLKVNPKDFGLRWLDLNTAPDTEEKREQMMASVEDANKFFLDWIRYGRIDRVNAPPEWNKLSWGLEENWEGSSSLLRNSFDSFVNMFVKRGNPNFHPLFEMWFGDKVAAFTHGGSVDSTTQRVLRLPKRRVMLKRALDRKWITEEVFQEALYNTESHIVERSEI